MNNNSRYRLRSSFANWARSHAWLSPATAVTIVLGYTIWIYSVVLPGAKNWNANISQSTSSQLAFSWLAGQIWVGAAILFLVVTSAAVVVLATTSYFALRDAWQRPSATTLLWACAAIAFPAVVANLPPSPFRMSSTYVVMQLPRAMLPHDVLKTVDIMWIMTMAASTLVVVGASSCLMPPRHISMIYTEPVSDPDIPALPIGLDQDADILRTHSKRLQAILFAGATVLVAGVIELDALYDWAAAVAVLPKAVETMRPGIIAAATVPAGVFFSLFLAAAYVPAALILRNDGLALAKAALPQSGTTERTKWLQENGLNSSVTAQVSALVALLGPVLAGGPLNALGHAFG